MFIYMYKKDFPKKKLSKVVKSCKKLSKVIKSWRFVSHPKYWRVSVAQPILTSWAKNKVPPLFKMFIYMYKKDFPKKKALQQGLGSCSVYRAYKYKLSKVVKSCKKLSKVVKSCQKLSKVVKSCQKLSKVVKSCQKLSKIVKSCQKLS